MSDHARKSLSFFIVHLGILHSSFLQLPQCRFHRGQYNVYADVNQVNTGKRNYEAAMNDDARVQDVVQYVKQRDFILGIAADDCDFARCRHQRAAFRA